MLPKTKFRAAEETLNRLGFSVVNSSTLDYDDCLRLKAENGNFAVSDNTGKTIGLIDQDLPFEVIKKTLQFYLAGFQIGVSRGEDRARQTLRDWLNK